MVEPLLDDHTMLSKAKLGLRYLPLELVAALGS